MNPDLNIDAAMAISGETEWNSLTDIEQIIIKWQKGQYGSFMMSLMETICRASEDNAEKLSRAFPDEVYAIRLWKHTWIAESLRNRGLL